MESVTLVFSSAYAGNPGSMFGHTFLRFNSPSVAGARKVDLLDYGVSYAADIADDVNSFSYVFNGLTGGFRGRFSVLPYYMKVNEYSNAESRDLWEYDLTLTLEEARRLLRKIVELERGPPRAYYFVGDNCSYRLLTLLEDVKPEWKLSRFTFHVIPAETVKRVVAIPNAVKSVKYRPSLRKRMLRAIEALGPAQKKEFARLISESSRLNNVTDKAVLESYISYLHYQKAEPTLLRGALVRRSELGGASEAEVPYPLPENSRPENGHHPYRAGVVAGMQRAVGGDSAFQELRFKFGYHDLLNDDTGFTPFSRIDFLSAALRFTDADRKVRIENLSLLDVASFTPLSLAEKKPSWSFKIDYAVARDLDCAACHVARVEGGIGAALELFSPAYLAYALLLANAEAGSALRKGFRIAPRAELAVLLNPEARYKIRLAASAAADLFQNDRRRHYFPLAVEQGYQLSQAWDLRLEALIVSPHREAKLALNHYF